MEERQPDFYLVSSEGPLIGQLRLCFILQRVQYATRKDCLLISISPPIDGRRYSRGDIDNVVLASRFKGDTLFPPNRWPLDVYVLRFSGTDTQERKVYEVGELINMAWGEIYKSVDDIPSSIKG